MIWRWRFRKFRDRTTCLWIRLEGIHECNCKSFHATSDTRGENKWNCLVTELNQNWQWETNEAFFICRIVCLADCRKCSTQILPNAAKIYSKPAPALAISIDLDTILRHRILRFCSSLILSFESFFTSIASFYGSTTTSTSCCRWNHSARAFSHNE